MKYKKPDRTNRSRDKGDSRFQYFKWSLSLFDESTALREDSFPLAANVTKTKYPIRVLRYWWLLCAIDDELEKIESPVIADVGCDRAIFKRLLKPIPGAKFIGMDLAGKLEFNKDDLELADYDEFIACDLDIGLPIPDSSVDILVNSHVLEHLPRPEFAVAEFHRVLRPGGLLLLGFPVRPKFIARIREKQYAAQFADGTRILGQHQHAFWPARARHMVESLGLNIEFMLGTYLIRRCGAFWENSALWMRANQLWGSLFPALSHELCIKARKPFPQK